MSQYQDGTVAQVGDVVKGPGCSLKDAQGRPRLVVGVVVSVAPRNDADLALAVLDFETIAPDSPDLRPGIVHPNGTLIFEDTRIQTQIEYGRAHEFSLGHRPGGSVESETDLAADETKPAPAGATTAANPETAAVPPATG